MKRRDVLKTGLVAGAGLSVAPYVKGFNPNEKLDYTAAEFGDDFLWGVATAAYQIEGCLECRWKRAIYLGYI